MSFTEGRVLREIIIKLPSGIITRYIMGKKHRMHKRHMYAGRIVYSIWEAEEYKDKPKSTFCRLFSSHELKAYEAQLQGRLSALLYYNYQIISDIKHGNELMEFFNAD